MSKVVKFVVLLIENALWMENKAIGFYTAVLGDKASGEKYVAENLSHQKLIRIQNDFSVEMLMVHEAETPLSFMKLNSSRLYNQNTRANKPMGIEQVVYFNSEELSLLLKRAEAIAAQRKHDLIWIKVFEKDTVLKEILQSFDYREFHFDEQANEDSQHQQLYFKKELLYSS